MGFSWPINIFKAGLNLLGLICFSLSCSAVPDPGLIPTLAVLMQLSYWVGVLATELVVANNAVLLASLDATVQE